jgi:phenylacetic acid degradation operon negative regulatory protein
MAAEGWVEPRRAGRYAAYRLTPRGADRLDEAATRIYRLRAAPWDGRWRLLALPGLPEHVARELGWMGFGRLPGGMWVSPHDHGDRLPALLDGRERLLFTASVDDDRAVTAQAWDLSALQAAHEGFLAAWPAPDGVAPGTKAAFAERIRLVHHWRSFLFLDPGLPEPVLPEGWLGMPAAARFHDRYEWLSPGAMAWWAARQAAAPAATAGAA